MPDDQLKTLSFDYVKGTDFRVLHVDGAFMAGSPTGLSISFYSERQAIPRRSVHKVNPDQTLGEEILEQRVVRDAVVRDVDVTLVLSLEVAKNVKQTLERVIEQLEKMTAAHLGSK